MADLGDREPHRKASYMTSSDALAEFSDEAHGLLETLEAALLTLEATPNDGEIIDQAFRAMHTIKGSGAMVGYAELAAFTHQLETVFTPVRERLAAATPELISVALRCVDHIRTMVDHDGLAPAEARETDEALICALDALKQSPIPSPSQVTAPAASNNFAIRFRPGPSLLSYGLNPVDLFDELRTYGSCEIEADVSRVPPLSDLDPQVLNFDWHLHVVTSLDDTALRDIFMLVPEDTEVSIVAEVPPAATEAGAGPQRTGTPRDSNSINDGSKHTVRVATEKLDRLVEIVGELVIAQSRLQQNVDRAADENLTEIAEHLERLTTELRDSTLGIRMRPVGQTFSRFQRLVRDVAHQLGKQVIFETQGDEVELDKSVIDRLVDPLVHLLRNAMDHGIESPEVRTAAGKESAGRLRLCASQQYGNVIIELSDDGAGIDPERVAASARRKGLIGDDDDLSHDEMLQLILQPGFTTRESVSDLSGRGVGLDVVRQTIDSLNGQLRIRSTAGVGTTFVLSLPLTLSIIEGLLVRVGDEDYVLPLAQVDRVLEIRNDDEKFSSWQGLLPQDETSVPYIRLRQWFRCGGEPSDYEKVIVVQTQSHPIAYIVDEVRGHGQIVVKEMIDLMQRRSGVSGATILGDGRVALILDCNKLLNLVLEPS